MYKCCCCDKRIAYGLRVGYMKLRAALRYILAYIQNARIECGHYLVIEPRSEHCALHRIAPL